MNLIISKILFTFLCAFSFLIANGQGQGHVQKPEKDEPDTIRFEADIISYDRQRNREAKLLKGNVVFRHEGVLMYCDSADFYSNTNSLDAYGNIHINQGDTVDLWGDLLSYNGNTRYAKVRLNVILKQDSAYLMTDSLNYDRNGNLAWFPKYGKMVDSTTTLESILGYYYTVSKDFKAIDSVVLTTPDYTIYSDTLLYNTDNEIAIFFGPTEIISDDNYLYCENGQYNTKKDIAKISVNAFLKNEDQTMWGDSIYYERYYNNTDNGFCEAFDNVTVLDTVEKLTLKGHYGFYFEEPERVVMYDSAYCIHELDNDSLFLHADTLKSNVYTDTLGDYKVIIGYYRAKLFKSDFQGKCDSLNYIARDSVIRLYFDPILWSEENQMTADSIQIYISNGNIDHAVMENSAMTIAQQDSIRFNQIKGKKMVGYFVEEELDHINVDGNGETVYFATQEDGLIGVNKATGAKLDIYMSDGEVDEIVFHMAPEGVMNPPQFLSTPEMKLKGFKWLDEFRPKKMEDILTWEGVSKADIFDKINSAIDSTKIDSIIPVDSTIVDGNKGDGIDSTNLKNINPIDSLADTSGIVIDSQQIIDSLSIDSVSKQDTINEQNRDIEDNDGVNINEGEGEKVPDDGEVDESETIDESIPEKHEEQEVDTKDQNSKESAKSDKKRSKKKKKDS